MIEMVRKLEDISDVRTLTALLASNVVVSLNKNSVDCEENLEELSK